MESNTQANSGTLFTISKKTWPSFAADWRIPASVLLSDFNDRVKDLSDRGYGVVDLGRDCAAQRPGIWKRLISPDN